MLSAADVKNKGYRGTCFPGGLRPSDKTDKLKIKVIFYYKISVVINMSTKQYGNIQEERSIKRASQTQYQNLDGLLNIKAKKKKGTFSDS